MAISSPNDIFRNDKFTPKFISASTPANNQTNDHSICYKQQNNTFPISALPGDNTFTPFYAQKKSKSIF